MTFITAPQPGRLAPMPSMHLTPDVRLDLGRRVAGARVAAGIRNRQELADRIRDTGASGWSYSQIRKLETGDPHLNIDAYRLAPVADALGVAVHDLLPGPGDRLAPDDDGATRPPWLGEIEEALRIVAEQRGVDVAGRLEAIETTLGRLATAIEQLVMRLDEADAPAAAADAAEDDDEARWPARLRSRSG